MPTKNSIKTYVENGYYHVYNRGVEKRTIFEDEMDYKVFLNYLKQYLSPEKNTNTDKKEFSLRGRTFKGVPRQVLNYSKEIELVAFCLMPNHFHLLIKQLKVDSMQRFIKSLLTRYSLYFNKRYKRVGTLFQGKYKAVLIEDDEYLLHLSRYIHLNPLKITQDLKSWYSSYANYIGLQNTPWLKPKIVLDFFKKSELPGMGGINTYKDFVEKYKQDSKNILGNLVLE